MTLPNCDLELLKKFKTNTRAKRKYKPDLDEMSRRALRIHNQMRAARKQFKNFNEVRQADQAMKNALVDNIFTNKLGDVVTLKGVNVDRIDRFMASMFAENTRFLGTSAQRSVAGKVNVAVKDAKRIGSGIIDVAAKYQSFKKVREAKEVLERVLKHAGIKEHETIHDLMVDAIEIGQIPKNRVAYSISPAGDAFNMRRHQDWLDDLRGRGISQKGIDEIEQAVTEISTATDEVRVLGTALGIDQLNVDGVGFLSRILTKNARRFVDNTEKAKDLFGEINKGTLDPTLVHDIGRRTFNYVPEDLALIAYQLKLEVPEVNQLIMQGNFGKYLHKNASSGLIDNMVDMGTLSKIPMTSREVFNYMVSQYDLPFKGMSELFVTDPERVFQLYTENLSKAAGESQMMKLIVKDGLDNGWAVTKSMVEASPNMFKGWRQMSAEEIKQFIPGYNKFSDPIYMHPAVGDTWRTYVQVSQSPEKLAGLANTVNYWGTFMTKTLLMRPGYVVHQVADAFMQTAASGGNLFRVFEGQFDVYRLRSRGLDAFDNVQEVYKGLDGEMITKRQLMEELITHRDINLAPRTLGEKASSAAEAFNPVQIPRALNYAYSYITAMAQKGGAGVATKATAQLFADVLHGAHAQFFSAFATSASFFELSGKWTALMSLADTRPIGKVGSVISGAARPKDFNNLRDIFNHLDSYFYAWDDIGKVDNVVGRFVRPFAPYAFKNPPAQIRQAMINPKQFVNYLRIRQFLNQDFQADPDTNEASVPQYILDGAPVALSKDTESGNWWTLLTTNFDPRADAINFFEDTANEISRKQGGFIGTSQEQLDDLNEKPGLSKVFKEWGRETLPLWKNGISLISGIDIATGRAIERSDLDERQSFLGLDLSPLATFVLSAYPPLDALNTSNPFGVFGTPEIRDPKTNEVIVEGTPSFAGTKRTSLQLDRYSAGTQQWAVNLAQFMGVSVKLVDIARSTQWTFAEVERQTSKMSSALSKTTKDLKIEIVKGNTNTTQFKRRVQAHNKTVEQWAQLSYERLRLAQWMKEKGIPPKSAFDQFEGRAAELIEVEIPGSIMGKLMEEAADYYIDPVEFTTE